MKPVASFEEQTITVLDVLQVNDSRLLQRLETLDRKVSRIQGELSNLQLRHDNLLSELNFKEN